MTKIKALLKRLWDQIVSVFRDCPLPLLLPGLAFFGAGVAIGISGVAMAIGTHDLKMLALLAVGICVLWYGRFWLTGFRRGVIVEHRVVCIAVYSRRIEGSIYAVFRDLETDEQYTHTIYGKARKCPYVEKGKYTIYMQAGSQNSILGYTQ